MFLMQIRTWAWQKRSSFVQESLLDLVRSTAVLGGPAQDFIAVMHFFGDAMHVFLLAPQGYYAGNPKMKQCTPQVRTS